MLYSKAEQYYNWKSFLRIWMFSLLHNLQNGKKILTILKLINKIIEITLLLKNKNGSILNDLKMRY